MSIRCDRRLRSCPITSENVFARKRLACEQRCLWCCRSTGLLLALVPACFWSRMVPAIFGLSSNRFVLLCREPLVLDVRTCAYATISVGLYFQHTEELPAVKDESGERFVPGDFVTYGRSSGGGSTSIGRIVQLMQRKDCTCANHACWLVTDTCERRSS